MATLSIFLGEDQILPTGSGIGFFGDGGFDFPIQIGEFNGRSFVTNTSGTLAGFEVNNIKYFAGPGWGTAPSAVSGVILGQTGSGLALIAVPNTLASLNVRFEHTSNITTQNIKLFSFDGVDLNNPQSGIDVFAAELRHTGEEQSPNGLGDTVWQAIGGATVLNLISSPGSGGFRPDGPSTSDIRHDHFIALSMSPNEPGNKLFSFAISMEFQ